MKSPMENINYSKLVMEENACLQLFYVASKQPLHLSSQLRLHSWYKILCSCLSVFFWHMKSFNFKSESSVAPNSALNRQQRNNYIRRKVTTSY